MRLIYKRFSVITGFAVLLAVLMINTAVTRRQIAIQDSNQDWAEHTQRVLLELSTVESLLKDAETGQRGY
jgi:CHASE3 domain sensor protein